MQGSASALNSVRLSSGVFKNSTARIPSAPLSSLRHALGAILWHYCPDFAIFGILKVKATA
jgi:hypothetical protein